MKAKPSDQLTLLDLQALDQRESVLRHKRDSHPAHGTVRELAGRIDDLQRSQITQTSVIDLSREIERITHEIELVSARRDRQRGRIEANEVPLRDISSILTLRRPEAGSMTVAPSEDTDSSTTK